MIEQAFATHAFRPSPSPANPASATRGSDVEQRVAGCSLEDFEEICSRQIVASALHLPPVEQCVDPLARCHAAGL